MKPLYEPSARRERFHLAVVRPSGYAIVLLIVIIAVGMAFRLIRLDHPCLWGDEGWVYGRTCGSFTELMQILRHDGFMPLLYIWDWWLGAHVGHSPPILRLTPTICGIIMVPAMYLLTMRLLASCTTALWVAGLTACSTFLVVYSRDAKPYMPLWCFEALSAGALLWWLDKGRKSAWAVWLCASALMIGLHGLGLIALALQIVLFANSGKAMRRRWPGFLLGITIVLAGTAAYYAGFNRWVANIHENGWHSSGLDWIGESIAGHGGASLSLNSLCIFMDGWSWIERGALPNWIVIAEKLCFLLLLGALGWALIPWKRSNRLEEATPGGSGSQITSVTRRSRAVLWLGASILVPPFICYCISFSHAIGVWIVWGIAAALIWIWFRRRRDLFPIGDDRVAGIITVIVLLIISLASWAYCATHHVNALWVPRYLGYAWPAVAIAICALLSRIPMAPVKIGALVLLLATNVFHTTANQVVDVEIRRDRLAADIVSAQGPNSTVRVYTGPALLEVRDDDGAYLSNPVTRYYLLMASGKKLTPWEFRNGRLMDWFTFWQITDPAAIATDAAADGRLNRLIVWEILPDDAPPRSPYEMLAELGKKWTCQGQELLVDREPWGLGEFHRTQRSVYTRDIKSALAP